MNGWQSKFISSYVDIILKTPVKILIVITSFTNLGISIYGATQLEANFDPFMFNANYEVAKMKIKIEKYFPSASPSVTRGNFLLIFLKGHKNRFLQDKYETKKLTKHILYPHFSKLVYDKRHKPSK